jgi:hypothetical protein
MGGLWVFGWVGVHVRMGGQNREKSLCVCILGPSKISSQASWLMVRRLCML